MRTKILICMLSVFCLLVTGTAGAMTIAVPSPPVVWDNFEPVPIDLYDLGIYNAETGDVLYSNDEPTLVAVTSRYALYLDFNVGAHNNVRRVYPETYQYDSLQHVAPTVIAKRPIAEYIIVGNVDQHILNIIDQGNLTWLEKQFMIWSYLGVDKYSLETIWTGAYGESGKDWTAIVDLLAKEAAVDIGTELRDAIDDGNIIAEFKANGYSSVTMNVMSTALKTVVVNVYLGTVLNNIGGQNQDIGIAETVTVYLPKGYTKTFTVSSYCVNMHKGVPSSNDALEIAAEKVDSHVLGTMQKAFGMGRAATSVAQSAVWHHTDGGSVHGDAAEIASVNTVSTGGDDQGFNTSGDDQGNDTGVDDQGFNTTDTTNQGQNGDEQGSNNTNNTGNSTRYDLWALLLNWFNSVWMG